MSVDHREEMTRRFFEFMAKREALRLRKESGAPWPWSDDPILSTYKFTNVKREHDRTTKWMREHWTGPNEHRSPGEIIFNCALFRYFGTVEFAEAIGWQTSWLPDEIASVATARAQRGERVFTGAYIIPTLGRKQPKAKVVCRQILTPLWHTRDEIAQVALTTGSWRLTAERMFKMPGFGGTGFMTKEVLQDAMRTPVLESARDRNTWCPAGPGARRGLNRIASRPVKQHVQALHALKEMLTLFQAVGDHMPSETPELELHDIQFQLCEFDKYERARLGEGRPKQIYRVRISENSEIANLQC